ncbi:hypothetical protein [Legionella maceachernii]|uniref:Methyltransferase domain protein n=1 Tax=Legionella maceachernii TaxID=466 RepID=A0A0W0VXW2_9GAMM|nr:hypothetical protein [Legionella maceachernii]KTD24924.1 hypothetical protein Lmac_2461 [Legionella maceachernii]SKA16430.1 hypothetical protein SAMN02745128_02369 [Legionella maceachernii]SUP01655.1 Uncharacterised protein [Legionella maceachernii]
MKSKYLKSDGNDFSSIKINFFKKDTNFKENLERYRKKLLTDAQAIIDRGVAKIRMAEQAKAADEVFNKRPWPNSRGKAKIATLHALNTEESLGDEAKTNQLDILSELPPKPVIVDLGMGKGQFLIDLAAELKKECDLVGISASPNEISHRACHYANISIVKGKLPHDEAVIEFLKEKQGAVDKVFDTFGPATYASNPLHSLMYAAILLKPGGKFSAMSSTENNTLLTVFGDEEVRKKIAVFFKSHLHIDINFEFSAIRSELSPGKINTDLLVTFTKGNKKLSASDYLSLCRAADREVGIPQVIKPSWYNYNASSYGMFSISMRTYKQFEKLGKEADSSVSNDRAKVF